MNKQIYWIAVVLLAVCLIHYWCFQFATSRQLSLVDLRSRTKLETNGDVIDFDSARQLSVIRDYARAMTGTGYYWSLPTGFLGNKVCGLMIPYISRARFTYCSFSLTYG